MKNNPKKFVVICKKCGGFDTGIIVEFKKETVDGIEFKTELICRKCRTTEQIYPEFSCSDKKELMAIIKDFTIIKDFIVEKKE